MGFGLAKKIKLADLSKEEKDKLRTTAVYSLLVTFFICVILVGCFACSQQTPNEQQNSDKIAESQRLYWTGILNGTDWTPQTNGTNDGILCGLSEALPAHINYDESTSCLVIGFGDTPYLEYGNITLSSCEGKIKLSDASVWSVKFSEKNSVKYMTIVDSEGKTVYYDCQ